MGEFACCDVDEIISSYLGVRELANNSTNYEQTYLWPRSTLVRSHIISPPRAINTQLTIHPWILTGGGRHTLSIDWTKGGYALTGACRFLEHAIFTGGGWGITVSVDLNGQEGGDDDGDDDGFHDMIKWYCTRILIDCFNSC